MVNFDKLGSRAGQENYPRIDQDWEKIPEKKRRVIKTLINNAEKSQNEIAEIAGVNSAHVHNVIYSLPPEEYRRYHEDVIAEGDVKVRPHSHELNEDDDTVTVTAPMEVLVDITIPRQHLNSAALAAMGKSITQD